MAAAAGQIIKGVEWQSAKGIVPAFAHRAARIVSDSPISTAIRAVAEGPLFTEHFEKFSQAETKQARNVPGYA
jgi:hypothetical protein